MFWLSSQMNTNALMQTLWNDLKNMLHFHNGAVVYEFTYQELE